MPQTIKIKRSVGSTVPPSLEDGEIAFSHGDDRFHIGDGSGIKSFPLLTPVAWVQKVSNFNAVNGGKYFLETGGTGAVTMTLPSNPASREVVSFADFRGNISTVGNVTINRNGQNIMSLVENLILDYNFARVTLEYVDFSNGWVITNQS